MPAARLPLTLLLAAVAAAALPASAAATGPPVLGGESTALYRATIRGGGNLEVSIDAGTDRVSHMRDLATTVSFVPWGPGRRDGRPGSAGPGGPPGAGPGRRPRRHDQPLDRTGTLTARGECPGGEWLDPAQVTFTAARTS